MLNKLCNQSKTKMQKRVIIASRVSFKYLTIISSMFNNPRSPSPTLNKLCKQEKPKTQMVSSRLFGHHSSIQPLIVQLSGHGPIPMNETLSFHVYYKHQDSMCEKPRRHKLNSSPSLNVILLPSTTITC